MIAPPPHGSGISIEESNGHPLIIIPQDKAGKLRFLVGAFLLFWLGGWIPGGFAVIAKIIGGEGNAFLFFWLGGWFLGCIFAGHMLRRAFQKPVSAMLLLNSPNLSFDTGVPPLKMDFGFGPQVQREAMASMFPKRRRIQFSPTEIASMELRTSNEGNRLTLDKGASRIGIAESATEIEREWLYQVLKDAYS